MATVYLETSFFSFAVTSRTDGYNAFRKEETLSWWTNQRHLHELFVSPEVIRELSSPIFKQSEEALVMTAQAGLLTIDESVYGLAQLLVSEKAMPGPAGVGDALHVAVATIHKNEFMISWNVKHLANVNKQRHLQSICLRVGLVAPTIVTPDQLWRETDI